MKKRTSSGVQRNGRTLEKNLLNCVEHIVNVAVKKQKFWTATMQMKRTIQT